MHGPTRSRWWLASSMLALVALAAPSITCTRAAPTIPDPVSRPSDPYPLGAGCEAQPDPHCNNLVNRVLVPMYRGGGMTMREESRAELCRRMALDLVGRTPTRQEHALCETETPEQMADRFMASPEYVRQQRRTWGERFYNLDEQWYPYSVEVDDLVELLYREHIPYAEFMTRLLVHPGFFSTFRGDDWSSNVVRYALNRNARADEIAALRALARVWDQRRFCDGVIWWNARTQRNGSIERGDGACGRDEYGVNFCRCRDSDGVSVCRTEVFGQPVDFGTEGCVDPENRENEANSLRVTDAGAGRGPVCPGLPHYNQCQDRAFGDDGPAGQLRRLDGISPAQRDRLYSLGRALASRPDFGEAAVDRELRRFLDWWQAGLRRPDFDVPAIRTALAEELRRTGSIRQLQRSIVTSLLYAQAAEQPEGTDPAAAAPPVWSVGPTRIMTAERWLDSVFNVTFGETAGVCDYRFVTENYDWRMLINRSLAMQAPTTNDFTENYREWAQALSGCSSTLSRATRSSLSIVTSQHEIALRLCEVGPMVIPPETPDAASPDVLGSGVNWLYLRAVGRLPSDAERGAAVEEMTACINEGGGAGCGTSGHTAIRWFCARLLDSAEFAVY